MAQGPTQPNVRVINPADLADNTVRELLERLLITLSITNVLLAKIAEATSGDGVDLDSLSDPDDVNLVI